MPDVAFPAGHQHQAVRLSQKSSETTAQLFRALDIQPPAHAFFKVMKNIQVCVSVAVGNRKRMVREFEDLRASVDTALGEYDPLAPYESELLPPNSSDTLKFFLKSLGEPHARLMEAAGNLVLIALLKNKTVNGGKMTRLLTLLRAMEKKPELSRQEVVLRLFIDLRSTWLPKALAYPSGLKKESSATYAELWSRPLLVTFLKRKRTCWRMISRPFWHRSIGTSVAWGLQIKHRATEVVWS